MGDMANLPVVIAELCCNHQGDFNIAVEMIKNAKLCGADYIKLQKRNPKKSIPLEIQNKPHSCSYHSFGTTYLKHREYLEFDIKQHKELKEISEEVGIGYSCSVWDDDSAREIISLNPDYIKVPSAMNENYELIQLLFNEYDKDIHISLGMLSKQNKQKLLDYLSKNKDRIVLYWTTSGYPVNFNELYLLEIKELLKEFPRIGFSGHHRGIAIDVAAQVLGATYFERHFTLDRTMKGTDCAASLEPQGLQKLVRNLQATQQALSYKKVDYTEDEKINMTKLKIKTPQAEITRVNYPFSDKRNKLEAIYSG